MAERDAVPARGGSSLPLPGGLGISLPALGPAREVHRWKCHRGWRDSCRVWPLCHEAWPRLSLGMNSPIGTEPWWDAERRARSALRAPHPKGAEVGYASVGVRLLCFFPFLHSWLEARIVRIPVSTAGVLWRRSVRRAERFVALFDARDDGSGANRIARTFPHVVIAGLDV